MTAWSTDKKRRHGVAMAQATVAPWAELVPGVDSLMTADELLTLPDDEWQYELVAGRLVRMPMSGLEHRDVTFQLLIALHDFNRDRDLGLITLPDTGFRLSPPDEPDTVLAPDIAFVRAERVQQLPAPGTPERRKFPPLAPDLAVEVASPDQYRPEMAAKARLYLAAGVRLVWVVWPRWHRVDVWQPGSDQPAATLGVDDQLDGLDVLPGFTYPVARLFG